MTSTFRTLLLLAALWSLAALAAPTDSRATADNRAPQVLALNVTPSAPSVGESVRLRAFGEDPDGDALRWRWTINGERQATELPELSLGQPEGGEYAVRVAVEDGRGGSTESELRFKVFRKTWCEEAGYFHDEATLSAYYTGAPSLRIERQALIDGYLQVLRDQRAAARAPLGDTDARSSARPTDRETLIQTRVRAQATALGRALTPPELFAIALEASGGEVGDALLAARDALPAVREQLVPLRDPRGYSQERAVKVRDAVTGNWTFVSATDLVGADPHDLWEDLYGLAAQAYADRHGTTPFALLRQSAGIAQPAQRPPLQARAVPSAVLSDQLTRYAIALQSQIGLGDRRAPDPDRQCVAYTGAAIGAALARERATDDPSTTPMPTPTAPPGTPYGSYLAQSPLSIELVGLNGERVGFDQTTQRYTGNTPNAIVELDSTTDGDRTVVITPLFPLREITLTGTGAGTTSFAAADLDAGFSRVWMLTVTAGARFRYEPAYALTDAAGTVVPHAAEQHHDRVWAFPQAPMLIIALTSTLGLLLGLIWVWRRGPFRAAPRLPPGAEAASNVCEGCGATRPGARFCRQCGRKLR